MSSDMCFHTGTAKLCERRGYFVEIEGAFVLDRILLWVLHFFFCLSGSYPFPYSMLLRVASVTCQSFEIIRVCLLSVI